MLFNQYFSHLLQVGDPLGDSGGPVLDFMSMKPYPDVSLDVSMLSSLGEASWALFYVPTCDV